MNILGYIFSVLLVTFSLLVLSGNAVINCNAPTWLNKSYSCSATVIIPNK